MRVSVTMGLLGHLHGTIAIVLILTLLFVDEAGLPLPLAPNEVLLVAGGVLIQAHALHAWLFYPAAVLVMALGMAAGYGWARLAGQRGLQALARRVGAESVYHRVQSRLRAAGPLGIGGARLLPGVRPWATLVSGAGGVDVGTFALGALPTLVLWQVAWTTLGVVIGLPAEHYFGAFERLILRGAILIVLGLAAYAIVRRFRAEGVLTLRGPALRLVLGLLIGGGSLASVTAGVLAIGRGVAHVRHHNWIDVLAVLGVLALAAVVALLRELPLKPHHTATAGRG